MEHTISIPVQISDREFASFALFDAAKINRRFRLPLIFACIMGGFSLICFLMKSRAEQAVLLGSVLLIIGLGLPLVYVGNFLSYVNRQAKMLLLSGGRVIYTLKFDAKGMTVLNKKSSRHYNWENISAVYVKKEFLYIYTDEKQAYICPCQLADGEVTSFIPQELMK